MATAVSVAGAEKWRLLDRFRERGLSGRTIKALVDHGIDAPERLLFIDLAAVLLIRGIGRAGVGEIERYRAWFAAPSAPR